jgi:IS6 family transposase
MAAGRICTAVDSRGRTVDFYLSSRRNSKAAYRFLGKILNNVKKWQIPRFINTDKAPAYGRALALLKREGRCRLTLNTDRLSTGTT